MASTAEKTLDEVYTARAEAFFLAMALAELLGWEVGVRGDEEWPVHFIVIPDIGEVALHVAAKDAEPVLLTRKSTREWDGHTDKIKSDRIRVLVQRVFAKK